MRPPWALELLLLLFLPTVIGESPLDPQLVLVAPRLVALGSPVGLLVTSVGPVTGTVMVWPGEGDRGAGPCGPPVPFSLGTHNDFSQILTIEVPLDQAQPCGVTEAAVGQTLLLEARSPPLLSKWARVGLGAPRGVILIQTDKPLYAPRQTVRFRIFSLDPDLRPNSEPVLITITNPLGARVREGQRVPHGPVLSDQMVLPDIALPGTWRVEAQLVTSPGTRGAAAFDVRPYVLPGFSVRAVPDRPFLLLQHGPSPSLCLRLHARYTEGAPVWGWALLRVGLRGGALLHGLDQRTQLTAGEAEFNVTLDAIASAVGVSQEELAGERLRLMVTAVSNEGGLAVRQEVGVGLVATPWALDISPSPRFFTPGAPYVLLGRVLEAGGAPAGGVEVRVGVGVTGAAPVPAIVQRADARGEISVPINVPPGATGLRLTVSGRAVDFPPARAELLVQPVEPVSGRFLLLGGPGGPLHPGETLHLTLHPMGPPPAPHTIHLLAVARGRLVAAQGIRQGTVTDVTLPVTPSMVPRLRLIAFFQSDGELVTATWSVPIVATCHRQVRVGVGRRRVPFRPQEPLTVTVTWEGLDPSTLPLTVALGATDAALTKLEPRHRLSPAQVEAVLGSNDLGCGPGGGPNAEGMFRGTGLVLGDANLPLDLSAGVARRCCRDGAQLLPLRVSCAQRSRRVPAAGGCRAALERCCRRARAQRRRGGPGLARVLLEELEEELEEGLTPTRSFFPESWMWRSLPGPGSVTVLLPDSITTWEIEAIAVVPGHGLCVATAQRVPVAQDLYIRLQLPPSTRPHEQLQLLPHIHSRLPHSVNVSVSVAVPAGVCGGLSGPPAVLTVPPGGAVAVPVSLVALRPGQHPLTLRARGPWGVGDSITQLLHVEPEGELYLEETTYVLDTDGESGRRLLIPGNVPGEVVPNGEFSVSIRVTGRVGSWALRGALGVGRTLLSGPAGCGEQALLALAPRAAALRYLDLSEGWAGLPPGTRPRALRGLHRGLERVQSFRRPEGCYSAWPHRGGSTWLTALVLRVLSLARPYLPVAANGPALALRWLLQQQRSDGAFHESHPVLHREMQGSLADPGAEAVVALTAFVAVALQGARVLLPSDSTDHHLLDRSLSLATSFLSARVGTLGPFGMAITAYALALGDSGPPGPSPALQHLYSHARTTQGGRAQFWPAGGPAATVEATAYGLLALLQHRDMAGATRVARWLREQSNYGGGFHSTQDTLVALEALSQLWLQWGGMVGTGLSLRLSWAGGSHGAPAGTRVTLGPGLQSLERELQVPLGSPITVEVEGHGEGTLTVLRQFRLLSPLNGTCQGLHLEVALTGPIIYEEEDYEDYEEEVQPDEETDPAEGAEPGDEAEPEEGAEPGEGAGPVEGTTRPRVPSEHGASRRRRSGRDAEREAAFVVCMWRELGLQLSGMAVLELTLLSGFRPRATDLDKMRDVVDRWISHYELSGTRLVIYLDQVPAERQCLSFGATQEVAVGQLQPALAAIYDYYEPGRRCSVFYSAPRRSNAVPTLCSDQSCLCAHGECPRLRQGALSLQERLDFACYSPRVDYALVIQALSQSEAGPFLAFEVEILEVLLGEAALQGQGQVLWRGSCPLRLHPRRQYLLMGEGMVLDAHRRPRLLAGPRSWVEPIPPRSRCGAAAACRPLLDFIGTLRPHGCPF
ncbi:complement C4-B-like [Colius striatus]|uniref:complement C4-B-like n=1 Tax=Colius striatus TaxID=57412 RepID=UPI002B1E9020|nr:complement C4-B-like [Colius striatus]